MGDNDEYVVFTTDDGDEIEMSIIGRFEHKSERYVILASFETDEGVLIMREMQALDGSSDYEFPEDSELDVLTDLAMEALSGVNAAEPEKPAGGPGISDLERAIELQPDPEKRAAMCLAAGDAYERGTHGADVDVEKACDFYGIGADLGNIQCLYRRGMLLITTFWGENKELFSSGVYDVANCYSQGYEPARETLQKLLDSDLFPKIKSVDALIKFLGF